MKKHYKALLVDDERLVRQDLKEMLSEFDVIDVVGEADSVAAAATAIEKLDPDVIFLDIQMPGESGFDLLEKTKVQAKIIFVTAYDEYAIRAFEINALDYLLKPVNPERLKRAIERLELQQETVTDSQRPLVDNDHLFLLVNTQYIFLTVKSIMYVTAAGDYTEVYTSSGQKGLTQKTMKEWENRLPESHFCRIHRSTIINLDFLDRLEEWFNYSYRVFMKGAKEPFVMSRRYAIRLKDKLG